MLPNNFVYKSSKQSSYKEKKLEQAEAHKESEKNWRTINHWLNINEAKLKYWYDHTFLDNDITYDVFTEKLKNIIKNYPTGYVNRTFDVVVGEDKRVLTINNMKLMLKMPDVFDTLKITEPFC